MRTVMGNVLETDSDVASISDNESKERTDGDGMESETLVDVNKDSGASQEPAGAALQRSMSEKMIPQPGPTESTEDSPCNEQTQNVPDLTKSPLAACRNGVLTTIIGAKPDPLSLASTLRGSKSKCISPRELPPKSQLIQIKPPASQTKLNSRKSMEPLPEQAINKQRNPRFIPYEPYRGAVRPIVSDQEMTKKHSRNSSDSSGPSSLMRQTLINLSLQDGNIDQDNLEGPSKPAANTHIPDIDAPGSPSHLLKLSAQQSGSGNSVEKQSHALTLLKERLKIAEKDNDDLHKENIRLKKLLVDSLSGDIIRDRGDVRIENNRGISQPSTSESVDTLSNEIEVWRSKFLSSCVLVEQLTRENGALNDAVGTAANLLKDIKLSSSLTPSEFEQVNDWLRANNSSTTNSLDKVPTSS